jgi:DNA (cytosine-5)-methyltransferase 1
MVRLEAAYYNEIDPFACDWIRGLIKAGLITDGVVDDRSIADVQPADLAGFRRVHFFAGIAGWELALNLAGWGDEPIWTGSCPCQPFSSAGKGLGEKDPRHLWPEFMRLIRECKPPVVVGEQVASAEVVGTQLEAAFVDAVQRGDYPRANRIAKDLVATRGFSYESRWLDGVFADLEAAHYTCRTNDLPTAGVGAPHIRQRLYWLADTERDGGRIDEPRRGPEGRDVDRGIDTGLEGESVRLWRDGTADKRCRLRSQQSGTDSPSSLDGMGISNGTGSQPGDIAAETDGYGRAAVATGAWSDGLGNAGGTRPQERIGDGRAESGTPGATPWETFELASCRDGKVRRIPVEREFFPLVAGLPRSLGPRLAGLAGMAKAARRNRVGRLRGYGNAIVPEVAAEFIRAYMEDHR